MAVRNIVKIDEEKCTGCGECVTACAEGAIEITDGKARLVSETYCDGLGACLGTCPEGAITIEEREAVEFDEQAVKDRLAALKAAAGKPEEHMCPAAVAKVFEREEVPGGAHDAPSRLGHWPVQLALLRPDVPFLEGSDLLLAADCVAFAYGAFHEKFLKGRVLAVTCPKFNDPNADAAKLAAIFEHASPESITVVVMEVPCCQGLLLMTRRALALAGKDVPLRAVNISVRGEILEDEEVAVQG